MVDAIVDLLALEGRFSPSEYYSLNPFRGAACYSFENCLISGPSSSSSAIVYYWSGTGHHDFRPSQLSSWAAQAVALAERFERAVASWWLDHMYVYVHASVAEF
jgi:hypothetical protein